MMKKIVLAALASATVLGASGSAYAAQATANAGVTFYVGNACTLTAGTIDLGNFSQGATYQAFADRQGVFTGGAAQAGTDAARDMATVTCPTGVAWKLGLTGAANTNTELKDPSGAVVAQIMPYKETVDGVAQTGLFRLASADAATGTGNNAAQVVKGRWLIISNSASDLTTAFKTGTYTAAATATLIY